MSNIATVLREEIARQSRKELRSETEGLKKASSKYRSEIAALKRRVAILEQQVGRLVKLQEKAKPAPSTKSSEESPKLRFRIDGLKKLRERLELSAPKLAGLLGVSPQTIYNWEAGSSRPNPDLIARLATLRKMGKRELQQLLAQGATA